MPDTDRLSDLDVDEALIYVRERPETPAADDEAISGLAWGPTLRKVEISDAELDRLRRQVGWIAGRLATSQSRSCERLTTARPAVIGRTLRPLAR